MVQQLFSERIEWEWKILSYEMMMTSKENVYACKKPFSKKNSASIWLWKQEFSQEEIGKC